MKKIMNGSFLGVCFLAALIAEAYFIRVGTANLFSVVGIGIVALITGYMLMEEIRCGLDKRIKDTKLYLDQLYKEESEKTSERFTEENNLHKATYTALKKGSARMSQHVDEIMDRLEALEKNMARALSTMTELQKKAMEGQKNALNFEINYNKENTKRLIQALREENNRAEVSELLIKMLNSMERNNELLEKKLNNLGSKSSDMTIEEEADRDNYQAEKVIEVDWNDIAQQEAESNTSTVWDSDSKEPVVDNLTETGWDLDAELTMENITEGWEVNMNSAGTEAETLSEEAQGEDDEPNWDRIGVEYDDLTSDWDKEENAPEAETAATAETEPEALQIEEELVQPSSAEQEPESSKPSIAPPYSDPNKSLTADEIAALFASFGQ